MPNGQIVVLDTANYGPLNISKSLEVTAPQGVKAFITVPAGTPRAISVNVPGSGSNVTLRGLIIEGGGNRASQTPNINYGILVTNCDHMTVDDSTIRNFYDGLIAGANVNLLLAHTDVRNCRYGVDTEAANEALITECTFTNNGDAVYAASDSNAFVPALMEVARGVFLQNGTAVRTVGVSSVNVGNCTFGVKTQSFNTSQTTAGGVYTYGNNQVEFPGAFTGTVSMH